MHDAASLISVSGGVVAPGSHHRAVASAPHASSTIEDAFGDGMGSAAAHVAAGSIEGGGSAYGRACDDPEAVDTSHGGSSYRGKVYGFPDLQPLVATPKFLRVPHIQTGYRVHLDVYSCAQSMFWIHNETWNIWTHLFGFVYFVWLMVYASPVETAAHGTSGFTWADTAMYNGFLLSAQGCMLGSTIFHTFNCMSESWNVRLYKLDLLGIMGLILGSYSMGLYYGFYCNQFHAAVYLGVLLVLLSVSTFFAVSPKYQHVSYTRLRVWSLTATVVFGVTPSIHWGAIASIESFQLFVYYLAGMFLLYFLGFLFYSSKVPERLAPGSFDVYLHSHQWWHVFVFLAAAVTAHGFAQYMSWRVHTECDAAVA